MRQPHHNLGFSLIEILMAVAILAIGMLLIGGTFMLGIHYSVVSTEQSIAAEAAQEAFAKIQLYGLDLEKVEAGQVRYMDKDVAPSGLPTDIDVYPSSPKGPGGAQYRWLALVRLLGDAPSRLAQVTVFVCQGPEVRAGTVDVNWVIVEPNQNDARFPKLIPRNSSTDIPAVYNGTYLVDDSTGQTYRASWPTGQKSNVVQLDRPWTGSSKAWLATTKAPGARNPCIAVYQTEIRF